MNARTKTILGFVLFAALLAASYYAYNNLSQRYRPDAGLLQYGVSQTKSTATAETGSEDTAARNEENAIKPDAESASEPKGENIDKPDGEGGAEQEEEPQKKIPAPDFTMEDADGNQLKLSDLFGKPIVLNFWATWCVYCVDEMPHFDSAYEEYKDDVEFIMLDLTDGQRETVQKGKDFIADKGYGFPLYFDIAQEASYLYGISSIPLTLFIDSEGNVAAGYNGALNEEILGVGLEMILGR